MLDYGLIGVFLACDYVGVLDYGHVARLFPLRVPGFGFSSTDCLLFFALFLPSRERFWVGEVHEVQHAWMVEFSWDDCGVLYYCYDMLF